MVGLNVGVKEGALVGASSGPLDGRSDGAAEGETEGDDDSTREGDIEGEREGLFVVAAALGRSDGVLEDLAVGPVVGVELESRADGLGDGWKEVGLGVAGISPSSPPRPVT